MYIRIASAMIALALFSGSVSAVGIKQPMTFELVYDSKVIGRGQFTQSTVQDFRSFLDAHPLPRGTTVFFLSFGGDLDAGMAVGETIREKGFNSSIGSPEELPPYETLFPDGTVNSLNMMEANRPSTTPELDALLKKIGKEPMVGFSDSFRSFFPGYCLSACAYAFLGGVERSMIPGSRYGLHQFAGKCATPEECMKSSQEKFGTLLAYVQKMGADPALLTAASVAGPDSFAFLPMEDLDRYRVLYTPVEESWVLHQDDDGRTLLVGDFHDPRKTQRVSFGCSTLAPGTLAMRVDFAFPASLFPREGIETSLKKMAWLTSNLSFRPSINKWVDSGHLFPAIQDDQIVIREESISWAAQVPEELVNSLRGWAKTFVVSTTAGVAQWPIEVAGATPDHQVFQRFLKSCGAP
jgi:hypothetical protein